MRTVSHLLKESCIYLPHSTKVTFFKCLIKDSWILLARYLHAMEEVSRRQWPCYLLPPIFFGGKYDLIQLYRHNPSKWLSIYEKLIAVFTTCIFCLKNKVNNKNVCTCFFAFFCSSRRLNEIGPTAENEAVVAIPHFFFLDTYHQDLWAISANVNNYCGLFATHLFRNFNYAKRNLLEGEKRMLNLKLSADNSWRKK